MGMDSSREKTHTQVAAAAWVWLVGFLLDTHTDTQKVPCCSRRHLCSYDALGQAVSTLLCNWLSEPHINTISHVSNPVSGNMAVSMSAYVHVLSKVLCSQYQNHQTTVIIRYSPIYLSCRSSLLWCLKSLVQPTWQLRWQSCRMSQAGKITLLVHKLF